MEDENRDIIASMNALQKPYSFFTLDDWGFTRRRRLAKKRTARTRRRLNRKMCHGHD